MSCSKWHVRMPPLPWKHLLILHVTHVHRKQLALLLPQLSLIVVMARHLKPALLRMWAMAKTTISPLKNSTSELQKLSNELKSLQTERLKRERAKKDLLVYASIINIPSGPIRDDDNEEAEVEEFKPRKRLFGAHHLL